MLSCQYIIVVDCFSFFYQWRVHFKDRHKLTIINHKKQESFNVAIMKYKNSLVYVQRQINRLLRFYRRFVKAYVDDIVIYSKTLKEHFIHLRKIFDMLDSNNISIKSKKAFIDYFTIHLLNQKINSLKLIIAKEKLKIISRFFFSKTLQLLKIYLDFIDWMRDYVLMYADISQSLQQLKIELLREEFVVDAARRKFFKTTRIQNSTSQKITSFKIIQSLLTKSFYLVHSNSRRKYYVDLNFNKKFDLKDMIYHVKKFAKWNDKNYSLKSIIEFILFFSRLFSSIETRYWFIELKIIDVIWVLRKIRHLLNFSKQKSIVIFIDHDAVLNIIKQVNIIIISIDKLNLRFVKVFDYIQRFELDIRHKSSKQHIVSNVLFRLININIDTIFDENELNVLFITVLIEVEKDFLKRIIEDYFIDVNWKKISVVLDKQNVENDARFFFYWKINEFIFRSNEFITDDHAYESRRLCIFHSIIQNILVVAHDDNHFEFARCYERISFNYYIRDFIKYFRDFLKHCFKCQTYQTRRHLSYDFLQFIFIFSIFFHTITIDFILILSIFFDESWDCMMSVNCKYFKRIILIFEKITWFATQWKHALLD